MPDHLRLVLLAGPDEARLLEAASTALALGAQPADVAQGLAAWAERWPSLIGSSGPIPATPIPDCCLDCGGPVEADRTPTGTDTIEVDGVRRKVWRCLRNCGDDPTQPPPLDPWAWDRALQSTFTACTALVPWEHGSHANVQVGCLLKAGHPGEHLPAPF